MVQQESIWEALSVIPRSQRERTSRERTRGRDAIRKAFSSHFNLNVYQRSRDNKNFLMLMCLLVFFRYNFVSQISLTKTQYIKYTLNTQKKMHKRKP